MSDKIHTFSDDDLTRLRHVIDTLEEKSEEFEGMKKTWTNFEEAFAEQKARLERLEDRGVNPGGKRHFQDVGQGHSEERRQALVDWVRDAYCRSFIRGYEPKTFDWDSRDASDVQTAGTDADGGYTVPELVAPEIYHIVEKVGAARQLATVMPMGSDTVHLTSRDVSSGKGVKVLWPGEATAPTEDKEEFTRSTLQAKKLVGLTPISHELDRDSSSSIVNFLLTVFGRAIAKEEDTIFFTGTGTPFSGAFAQTNAGVVTQAATANADSFSGVEYDDLVNLQYAVDDSLIEGGGTFVTNPANLQYIRKLKDTTGNPIWAPLAPNQPASILGQAYATTTAITKTSGASTKWLLYGDWSLTVLGQREGFSVAFSDEAGFKQGTRWMRVMEFPAVAFPIQEAIAYLKTAA